MNRTLLTAAACILSACAATPGPGAANPAEMKMAFDITEANPQALLARLEVIDLTRKQLIERGATPRMVLAFRGGASQYTQTNLSVVKEADRAEALKVAHKLRELKQAPGIERLEQCNVSLAPRKLKPSDLMPEVALVPNGWITLTTYQQQGYAYIVP
jgi:intracellular sulfur oxidation DsrE/DsrF family protein